MSRPPHWSLSTVRVSFVRACPANTDKVVESYQEDRGELELVHVRQIRELARFFHGLQTMNVEMFVFSRLQ